MNLTAGRDSVLISELSFDIKLGCTTVERGRPQRITVDLDIGVAAQAAARSRSLNDTVCYETLSKLIRNFAAQHEWKLVEEFCEDVAKLIFENFSSALSLEMLVRKYVLANASWAGVRVFRKREQ